MSEEKKVEVLQSEYLFNRPWLTVRRESIVLPNGNPVPEYYVLEYPEWVNTIAITRDRKFVFIRQYRHGLGCALMELCAGVCDRRMPRRSPPPDGSCLRRPVTAVERGAS